MRDCQPSPEGRGKEGEPDFRDTTPQLLLGLKIEDKRKELLKWRLSIGLNVRPLKAFPAR